MATEGLDAGRAVAIGHLLVTVPVLLVCGTGAVLGRAFGHAALGMVVGVAPAWLYWSFAVPRWRRWALRGGAEPERLQRLAAATGLVWPRGWIFGKTEMRVRDDERE